MADFKEILNSITEGIKDMGTLEVVNYKGKISGATDKSLVKFDEIVAEAKGSSDFSITACTYVEIDGDMKVFHDKDISASEIEAHQKLVEVAQNNRKAMVDLFKDAIASIAN